MRQWWATRTGSWPGFIGALVVGFGVVGLALRRRADAPTWLRLSAVTTLGFAVAGVGAFYGGWQGSVLVTIYGLPVAFAADRWLLRDSGGDRPWTAGLEGAAVAFTAVVVASAGYLFGLGLAGYGLTLLPSRPPPRCRGGGWRHRTSLRPRSLCGMVLVARAVACPGCSSSGSGAPQYLRNSHRADRAGTHPVTALRTAAIRSRTAARAVRAARSVVEHGKLEFALATARRAGPVRRASPP